MQVTVDPRSGFCFGVSKAVAAAERELESREGLLCLGDIVHNEQEVARLGAAGVQSVSADEFANLRNTRVLIRAHGEPPQTYRTASENGIELIDATCPVVLKIQQSVRREYDQMRERNGQVVIFGRADHPEVIGLAGQTEGTAIVIGSDADLVKIDYSRPVRMFSQTTKSPEEFTRLSSQVAEKMRDLSGNGQADFRSFDTVCRQVSGRSAWLKEFASSNDVVIFVSGSQSSNGKVLFDHCLEVNPRSYMVGGPDEINPSWYAKVDRVGVCGATSTPLWLMEAVADRIRGEEGRGLCT